MIDSLSELLRMVWRPCRDSAQLAGPHHDVPPADLQRRKTDGICIRIDDPTASIRVPLNWLPAAETPAPDRRAHPRR
ncbi:MAG: hypothetical protein U0973_02745 [Xanthomonadaceae bacterium]|nr:hypothetical protein [Xanthomonadaceae bacterium]